MSSARHWHRPRVYAVALAGCGIALFAALGVWQLGRAEEKRQLLAAFAAAAQEAPHKLAEVRDETDARHFPHVHVLGKFLAERAYLLDERTHDGNTGVHAIGVFEAYGEHEALLVDRGWVAWNHAPGTTPAVPPLPDGATQLAGIYAPYPSSGLRVGGNALERQTSWPKLTLFLDRDAIGADLGRPVLPRILLLDPAPTTGFVREWSPNVMPPERHIAYAVQWFALAAAVLAVFVVVHWRKDEKPTR